MRNSKIKFVAVIMSLFLLANISGCFGKYRSNDDFVFESQKDGTAILISYDGEASDIVIPSVTSKGEKVVGIGNGEYGVFSNSANSLVIPDGVTSIGAKAFSGDSFTSIVIPDSVTSIGDEAFIRCNNLVSIEIPCSVTSIGESVFQECSALKSVVIPNTITSIPKGAFWWCFSLESVEIPDSVTSIGAVAFHECNALTSIDIPDSVKSIDKQAFCYCKSLTTITFREDCSVGPGAFALCDNLVSINGKDPGNYPEDWFTIEGPK